jgi:GNAT superfamily N-acetyltransferase
MNETNAYVDGGRLRMALPSDIDSLADLRWRLCTEDSAAYDTREKQAFVEAFRSTLPKIDDRTSVVHFVAEREARLVAALSIVKVMKIPSPDELDGAWGYLTNVYALPEFRNQGIGSELLALALDWAQSQRFELLIVWPSDPSYRFYQRAGFHRERDPLVLSIPEQSPV